MVDDKPWPEAIFDVFEEQGISQVPFVPDAGHTRLIELCKAAPHISAVTLTTEEEGIAQLCGAWLGGARGALLLQSSGVGNCINMLAMVRECRFPLLMLVTMRGEWAEFNPWQVPMGENTPMVLQQMGVLVRRCDEPGNLAETVNAAAQLAFHTEQAVAVLIGQRVIGIKQWD